MDKLEKNKCIFMSMKSHYGGPKTIVTFYCFLGFPCLNVDHINIMKEFHNAFAYYGRSKLKKVKC